MEQMATQPPLEQQHYVRAPSVDEVKRIQADCKRMGLDISKGAVRRVLYAASRVYGNCDAPTRRHGSAQTED